MDVRCIYGVFGDPMEDFVERVDGLPVLVDGHGLRSFGGAVVADSDER